MWNLIVSAGSTQQFPPVTILYIKIHWACFKSARRILKKCKKNVSGLSVESPSKMEWKKGCRAVVELFLPLTVLVFLFRSRCVLCNQVIMALHGLLPYPALDSPIRRSPSLPLDEAGRNPLHPPFLYVLDRRTTDEQTNQTEEFVKVIPFPSQHLPSQHGELIHFLYCSNALN